MDLLALSEAVRVDQGSEFLSRDIGLWAYQRDRDVLAVSVAVVGEVSALSKPPIMKRLLKDIEREASRRRPLTRQPEPVLGAGGAGPGECAGQKRRSQRPYGRSPPR